MISEKW